MRRQIALTVLVGTFLFQSAPARAGSFGMEQKLGAKEQPLSSAETKALLDAQKVQQPTATQRLRFPYRGSWRSGGVMRQAPQSSAAVRHRNPKAQIVSVTAATGDWSYVTSGVWRGWVPTSEVTAHRRGLGWRAWFARRRKVTFATPLPAQVKQSTPLLRRPLRRRHQNVVTTLGSGTTVSIVAAVRRYVEVTSPKGRGYVLREALSTAAPAPKRRPLNEIFGKVWGFVRKVGARVKGFFRSVGSTVKTWANAPPPSASAPQETADAFRIELLGDIRKCGNVITGINVASVKALASCAWQSIKKAAKAALVNLLRILYDQFVHLLRSSAPKAKEKLKSLAAKLANAFPLVRPLAAAVVAGIGAGGDAFVREAAACRAYIRGFNKESAVGVFDCLKASLVYAAKTGAVGAVRSLWDQFVDLVKDNCSKAIGKLGDLVGKFAKVIPGAKGLASGVTGALKAGCDGAVDKVISLDPTR